MDEPLTSIFLGVIALTALLQAAFVGGLAWSTRLGRRKVEELEHAFETKLLPLGARATDAAARVESATARLHAQARRAQGVVEEVSDKVEHALAHARGRLVDIGESMEHAAEDMEREEIEPVRERVGQVAAVARGVRRALEVWRGRDRVEDDLDEGGED